MQKVLFPEPLFPKTFGGITPLKQQSNPIFFEIAERQRSRRGSRRQGEPAAGFSFHPLADGKKNALFCGRSPHKKRAAAALCSLPCSPLAIYPSISKNAKWRCFAQPFRRKNLWKRVRERTFPERFFPLTLPLNISTFPAVFRPVRRGSVFYIRRGTRRVFFRSAV